MTRPDVPREVAVFDSTAWPTERGGNPMRDWQQAQQRWAREHGYTQWELARVGEALRRDSTASHARIRPDGSILTVTVG